MEGFEPPITDSKAGALPTWLHPIFFYLRSYKDLYNFLNKIKIYLIETCKAFITIPTDRNFFYIIFLLYNPPLGAISSI